MATLRFEVHVDKENATPANIFKNKASAGSVKGLGFQKSNISKITQPTPRKALFDVNRDPQQHAAFSKEGSTSLKSKDNVLNPVKQPLGLRKGDENQPSGLSMKKASTTKTSKGSKISERPINKTRTKTELSNRIPPKKQPDPEEEDGYDPDSIFARSERLSTYVDKLFAWRPPCLFGSLPESDSEASDHEDWMNQDILVEEEPICLDVPVMPDAELSTLLVDLPPMSPEVGIPSLSPKPRVPPMSPDSDDSDERPNSPIDPMDRSNDLTITPTPDTSLTFGSLKVEHCNLDLSVDEESQ